MEFTFGTLKEANEFGLSYCEDEPGSYFQVVELANGKLSVNLYEEDGYLINREPPKVTIAGSVKAPGKMTIAHLG